MVGQTKVTVAAAAVQNGHRSRRKSTDLTSCRAYTLAHTHLPSHAPRIISSIKDQVVCVSLGAAFTAAICNQTEALAGRFSVPVLYTSAVKRRESRAQLARVMAARAMVAKDRWGVTCDV